MPVEFDPAEFRAMFPAYADVTKYPDVLLESQWSMAICFISPEVCGCCETDDCWKRILYLLVAHLLWLGDSAATGNTGLVQSATIDKVSVTQAVPPYGTSQWRYWLNQSPWGQQLLALLTTLTAGGFYIGGLPEARAFRKWRGLF